MDNNGGQGASSVSDIESFSAPDKPTPSKGRAAKVTGVAAFLVILMALVGFGGGVVVGGLMAGGTGTAEPEGEKPSTTEPTSITTTVDTAMQDELDKKIDAYESVYWYGYGLRPFHESYLDAKSKLVATFATMKDDELSEFANASYPYEATISLEKVETTYAALFGEELQESDRINIETCQGPFVGAFEYNAESKEYKAIIPEVTGCGGMAPERRDSYRDSYAVEGNKAYVTVEVGRYNSSDSPESGVYSDFMGGNKVGDNTDVVDFVNASNKDSFTKYQYVFEKQDSGAWALKGLYPAEK